MWMADMVRGRINNSKICDPKTDVKEFYSILGIWWESYQIYYIDCLQNSWRMFSITSNIISSLSQLMIQAGMIKKGAVATAFIKMCNFCFAMLLIIFFLNLLLLQSASDPYINSFCSTATHSYVSYQAEAPYSYLKLLTVLSQVSGYGHGPTCCKIDHSALYYHHHNHCTLENTAIVMGPLSSIILPWYFLWWYYFQFIEISTMDCTSDNCLIH